MKKPVLSQARAFYILGVFFTQGEEGFCYSEFGVVSTVIQSFAYIKH